MKLNDDFWPWEVMNYDTPYQRLLNFIIANQRKGIKFNTVTWTTAERDAVLAEMGPNYIDKIESVYGTIRLIVVDTLDSQTQSV